MNDVGRRDFLKQAGAAGAFGAVGGGILGGLPTSAGAEPPEKAIVPPEARLTNEEMDYLKRWDAPTIANALERTKARPRDKGFMTPDIRPTFPELGPMVGYAVTATIKSSEPRGQGDAYVDSMAYYEFIQSIPAPRIMVIHDEDAPNPIGSFWGEVHGNLHQALGCAGVITDGGVRDLGPVRALKFHYFAAKVLVSHAYVHLVDFGKPVTVGGHTVKSGDILYGDEHGVIDIPHAFAKKTPDLCYQAYKGERASIELYKSPDFSIEKLKEFRRRT